MWAGGLSGAGPTGKAGCHRSTALGSPLLQHLHKCAEEAWPGLALEQLRKRLSEIRQFEWLDPRRKANRPSWVTMLTTKRTLPQQGLAEALDLDEPVPRPR